MGIRQLGDSWQNGLRRTAAKHEATQTWVGGMNADVQRRQPLRLGPLELLLAHVGQRHVVTVQKAEAEVVVHQVQRLAHAFRHLVNEAENALVVAGMDLVRELKSEHKPPILAPAALHLYRLVHTLSAK